MLLKGNLSEHLKTELLLEIPANMQQDLCHYVFRVIVKAVESTRGFVGCIKM